MRAPRFLVGCLAVVVGLVGAAIAAGGLLALVAVGFGGPPIHADQTTKGIMIAFSASYALTAILGYLIARQSWKHLRKPDRATAEVVSGIACFLLGGEFIHLAAKWHLVPASKGVSGTVFDLALLFGLVFALYQFYRHGLKRVAERAFPVAEGSGPGTTPVVQL